MPGVPSSRGCEACRKQKKKCDQASPACSRCARLNLTCVGAGEQKFKFMEEDPSRSSSNHHRQQLSIRPGKVRRSHTPKIIIAHPTHPSAWLINSLAATLSAKDVRYNLYWSFGSYLTEIPRRLGTNHALDDATAALVGAHAVYCSDRPATAESLCRYTRGLRTLRLYLDDPVKASAPETLCAANLLVLCETLLGVHNVENNWNQHAEGMAQMLKTRAYGNVDDPFEAQLLGAIRGTLAFEGLMNNRVKLSPHQWKALVNIPLFQNQYEGKVMRALCMVPYFIQCRTGCALSPAEDAAVLEEIQANYQMVLPTVAELKAQVADLMKTSTALDPSLLTNAYLIRMYGFSIWIAAIMCRVLISAGVDDRQSLDSQLRDYVNEILVVAEALKTYYPLGSMVGKGVLAMAWIGAADDATRAAAEKALRLYPASPNAPGMDFRCLEWMSRRLQLMDEPGS